MVVTGLFVGSGAYDSHESAHMCLLRCTPQACVYGGEAPTNYQREQVLRAPESVRELNGSSIAQNQSNASYVGTKR